MADDDDKRVEARLSNSRAGMRTTPEYVRELQMRQRESERINRPPPTVPFARVLKTRGEQPPEGGNDEPPEEPPQSEDEAKDLYAKSGVRHPGARKAGINTGKKKIIIKP